MAKYKLKASLITPLTDAGYIDGGGEIKLRVPTREQAQSERMFEMGWLAATEALQSDNPRAMAAMKEAASSPQKFNGDWKVENPSMTWFDVLPNGDPVTALVVNATDGVEVLARWERALVASYCKDTGTPQPSLLGTKAELQSILDDALAYYGRTP